MTSASRVSSIFAEGHALFPEGGAFAEHYTQTEKTVYARGFDTIVTLGFANAAPDFPVAIKMVFKDRMFDATQLRRCREEANILRRLASKHVIPLLDTLETDKAFVNIMPYASAGSLYGLVGSSKTLTEFETRNFASQALAPIAYMHKLGYLHGDIKPHNFLLVKNESKFIVQLCDFGMADRNNDDGVIKFSGLRGTTGYFSPEQINGDDYGLSFDLFAFGVVLYALLAGYAPFDPASNFEEVDFDARYWKWMSDESKDLMCGLLALEAADRIDAVQTAEHPWWDVEISEEQKVEKFVPPPDSSYKFYRFGNDCPEAFDKPAVYDQPIGDRPIITAEMLGNPNEA